ncbi:MAG: hypothetical protein U9R17_16600 [Thermodesulfobacteriota bacterium]|nr:hypothetical protein [Thermodesulfobacteriota bacterium]
MSKESRLPVRCTQTGRPGREKIKELKGQRKKAARALREKQKAQGLVVAEYRLQKWIFDSQILNFLSMLHVFCQ